MSIVRKARALIWAGQHWERNRRSDKTQRTGFLELFAKDERGAIAIIFSLSILVVVGVVGGAVDYGRWLSVKSKHQSAIDAAVLAAGRAYQITQGNAQEAIAVAEKYYAQLKPTTLSGDNTAFRIVDHGSAVEASTDAAVKTPFLGVAGVPSLPVVTSSKAVISSGGNSDQRVEISLMLDVTGSMMGTKIDDLRMAAKDLIDIVIGADATSQSTRVALAPFSEHVNVGPTYYKAVTGLTPETTDTRKTCVRERDTADRYTDASPTGGNFFDPGRSWGACRPQSTILPLTNDKATLKWHVDSLGTEGRTAGHLGIAWSWYMLSPKWNGVWTSGSQAAQYANKKTQKIAVLMTDGEFNEEYSGSSSTAQAREICSRMKATGITVYAVGFQLATGGEAYQTLSGCASSSSHFFNSTTGDELRQAFREIALQVATLRLSQ